MNNADKIKSDLQAENEKLRRQVAELKAENQALRRSETLFRRVIEEANDGILIIDETGRVIVFNAAQEKITGRAAEDVIGMDAVDLQFSAIAPEKQTPEVYRRFKTAMTQILTTGRHPRLTGIHQYQYIGKDGTVHTAQKSAFTIKTEKGYMLVSFDRNITERVRIEEALRRSEERYVLATEAGKVGVWEINLNTDEMYLDPLLSTMMGYGDGEKFHCIEDVCAHLPKSDAATLTENMQACIAETVKTFEVPHRAIHKDGSIRWFLARGSLTKDDTGKPVKLVGTSTDITELVSAQLESETLRDVTLALVSHTTVKSVLAEILEQAKKLVDFSTANVVLVEHGVVRTVHSVGYEKYNSREFVESLVYNVGDFPVTYTPIYTQEPIIIKDTRRHPEWVVFEPTSWIRSYIGIPIVSHDRVLGVLQFDSDKPDTFSAADVERLKPLTTAAAIAIENARLLSTAQKRAEQLALVHQAGARVNRLADEADILTTAAHLIRQFLRYDIVQIGKYCPETQTISVMCRAGGTAAAQKSEQSVEQGVIGRAVRTGKTQLVSDTAADPDYMVCVPEMQSELAIPIKTGDTIFGVLDVESARRYAFDEADVVALEALAGQLGVILENAKLYQQTKADAETKATLLKEVNHRVKNNLAVIIGLLYLEQRRQTAPDTIAMLENITNRVRGMATAHELLSASVWQPISLETLVKRVIEYVAQLVQSTKFVRVEVSPSPVKVAAEQASNVALVVNELATNAIKYAIDDNPVLEISVSINATADSIEMVVKDNGPGYSELVKTQKAYKTGLDLVTNLVEKNLGGSVTLTGDGGATAIVRFPRRA